MHCPSVAQRTPVCFVAIIVLLIASPAGLLILRNSALVKNTSSNTGSPAVVAQHAAPLLHPSSDQSTFPNQLPSPPPAVWNEEMGLTFVQDFPALVYNVTAVAQSDNNSYGPAYLLSGLSDKGYWYQVGLSYDWPLSKGGYLPGFALAYEVFDPSGAPVFPTDGNRGSQNYSGVIHPGDLVLLSLQFSNGQVVMSSKDWNTSASASESFAAYGGGIFAGLNTPSNTNGFFSGLMTEEHHAVPFYGSEAKVTYENPGLGLNAATMWVKEWNPGTNQFLFNLSSPVTFTDPYQFQYFSLNGTEEASNAYSFVTGSYSLFAVTVNYSIVDGGTGFSIPKLNYSSIDGNVSVALATTATTYFMIGGTSWSVNNLLGGSTSTQRWISAVSRGNVTGNSQITLRYVHEYYAEFGLTPAGAGTLLPTGSAWFAANTPISITANGTAPYLFVRWVANTTKITFSNSNDANTTTTILGPGTITANFALIAITLSKTSGSIVQGGQITGNASITGPKGTVSLSIAGLPAGAAITWAQNPASITNKVVADEFNISTSLSTGAGTYPLTITATSINGSNSIQYVLTVNGEIPLVVSYSVSDGSISQSPTFSYVYDGVTRVANLSQVGVTLFADNGSTWKLGPLQENTPLQRWITNGSMQGIVSSPASIRFFLYHQYAVNFTFSVSNGGNPLTAPLVKIYSLGTETSALANGSAVWVDALSSYAFSQAINSSTDRWVLSSPNQTGVITGSVKENSSYIHQVQFDASLEIIGSGSGAISPKFSYYDLGKETSTPLNLNETVIWIDAGTKWTVPAKVNGSATTGQRWIESSTNSSGFASDHSALIRYVTQYFVSVGLNNPSAGTVSSIHGWYNASLPIALTAKANYGWKFVMWQSSAQAGVNTSNSTSLMVLGPVNETAIFYPGLQISSGANGHVNYDYGNVSGTVPAGSSATIYVPPGTPVSLTALPDSTFYSSSGWSGVNQSSSAGIQNFAVSAPTILAASYSFNVLSVAIVAVILVGVIAAVAVVIVRRSGSRDFVDSAGHGWKW